MEGEGRKRGSTRLNTQKKTFYDSLDSLQSTSDSADSLTFRKSVIRRDREQHPDLVSSETFEVLAQLESGWDASVDHTQSRFGPQLEDVAYHEIQQSLTDSAQIFEDASRSRREEASRTLVRKQAEKLHDKDPKPIQIKRKPNKKKPWESSSEEESERNATPPTIKKPA
eukprot:68024-Rhodomonas_salina.1